MRIIRTVASMGKLATRWQRKGRRVALVPTMGYLHAGHASLIARARKIAGPRGHVVVSIFVNPTQFGPSEDLARYPRDLARDKKTCRAAGADFIFLPTVADMYPADFSTWVVEDKLSQSMEGAARPGHFRGVATVVAKLFLIVRPNTAVFGAKDYQQAAVIQRMVRDLNFPLKIVVAPTVRESDGLAMSSRNKYLSPAERRQAVVLSQAIAAARQRAATKPAAAALTRETARLVAQHPAAKLDYVSFFDPETLEPLRRVTRGARMALAVRVGKTRLIDNAAL